ncbi:hypothetical protein [Spiroplasma endosymbiont of Polydrusus formosus]|uniref:hypothetical protein n=1 Tax=Spiroplasma endosymbiont of Polydrusus formosus TaxID=3139326 RepID=UPI0035B536F4
MRIPIFCPIHLKIHECPENSNKAILSATENKIKAKINRMLNLTNNNEPDKTAKDEKGTIKYILANAKKNNDDIKNKLWLEYEGSKSIGVDENDIKAKVACLRAAVIGNK